MLLWQEHQGRLASTLDAASWSAVSRAFAAVAAFQRIQEDPKWVGREGRPFHQSVIEAPHNLVREGVLALGRLAGRQPSKEDPHWFEDFMLDEGRRAQVDAQRGSRPS